MFKLTSVTGWSTADMSRSRRGNHHAKSCVRARGGGDLECGSVRAGGFDPADCATSATGNVLQQDIGNFCQTPSGRHAGRSREIRGTGESAAVLVVSRPTANPGNELSHLRNRLGAFVGRRCEDWAEGGSNRGERRSARGTRRYRVVFPDLQEW